MIQTARKTDKPTNALGFSLTTLLTPVPCVQKGICGLEIIEEANLIVSEARVLAPRSATMVMDI